MTVFVVIMGLKGFWPQGKSLNKLVRASNIMLI